ncbi:MAG: glycosyltransferase family 2 protein [Gammaproteobacteria bacterium]|nr:glycosyltransferase family 2 protein [Gammaproteobacteria bacterium]
MPIVSIGMPVFNADDYIEAAIDSILAQTFEDYELIISDNGSTDNTEAICRSYQAHDERICYFRHQENLGAAWNHNFVYLKSSGRYFRWHSHDDICSPEYLDKCVPVLEEQPGAVLTYPATTIIDSEGRITDIYDDRLSLNEKLPHQRLKHYLQNVRMCNPVLGLIRSNALANTHLLGAYISADKVLLAELALQGRFIELPYRIFYRRVHAQKSTVANRTNRERAAWFSPANADSIVYMPNLRLFIEQVRVTLTAQLSIKERISCVAVISAHWTNTAMMKIIRICRRKLRGMMLYVWQ